MVPSGIPQCQKLHLTIDPALMGCGLKEKAVLSSDVYVRDQGSPTPSSALPVLNSPLRCCDNSNAQRRCDSSCSRRGRVSVGSQVFACEHTKQITPLSSTTPTIRVTLCAIHLLGCKTRTLSRRGMRRRPSASCAS